MGKVIGVKVPMWFRVVAVLGLLWNAYGVYMYLQSVGMIRGAARAAPAQAVPAWVTGVFAAAVFLGIIGSLLMVAGKRLACPFFVFSFVAVVAQSVWIVLISNARAIEGMKALILPGAITLVALLLMLVAARGAQKFWLD